jgi:hypothetical protein
MGWKPRPSRAWECQICLQVESPLQEDYLDDFSRMNPTSAIRQGFITPG